MCENYIQVPPYQGRLSGTKIVCVLAQFEETSEPKAEISALHSKLSSASDGQLLLESNLTLPNSIVHRLGDAYFFKSY